MWRHAAWQEGQLPASSALRVYASNCTAVEGNTTFYATPSQATARSWAEQTDPDFRFVMKLPKPISHDRRLLDAEAPLREFLTALAPLGPRVHAWWVQLPASFGPNELGALAGFLRLLPGRAAVEVRHPAFFTDERAARQLEYVLGRVGAEWVLFDTTTLFEGAAQSSAEAEARSKKPRLPRRTVALTEFPILRYHGRDDDERTIAGWQPWLDIVVDWLRAGRSPTVFLHTPDNVGSLPLARRFHAAVRARLPELDPLPEPEPSEPMTLF
ncbi:DUF72 domain-containing protein [Nocardia sp. NPDC127579]|uniref:DUF72 domain-containing protein n=1 Tax=Nocardia sp. NPDC127579 TaxID=3345402 RepID=UPI003643082C